jgi:hypothetical protein
LAALLSKLTVRVPWLVDSNTTIAVKFRLGWRAIVEDGSLAFLELVRPELPEVGSVVLEYLGRDLRGSV